jgi:sugar lactone lactonase YvrE
MVTHIKAKLTIDSRDKIGEGPTWDGAQRRLLWSDNEVGIIHEAKLDGEGCYRESNRWNVGRSIAAVIPRAKGGLIVVAGTEIFTLAENGDIVRFAVLDADASLVKGNEAKCDPTGRLWVGTRSSDFSPGRGALYRIDPDGVVNTMLHNVTISNGLDWSPDGSTFYYIDSPTLSVDAFDFDMVRGTISNRRGIATIKFGEGAPDGMTVDREGCLWVAVFTSGEVRRFAPDGALLARVEISAPAVTSCTFGGSDGGDLFITSAALRLPDVLATYGFSSEVLANSHVAPGAGGVFFCRPGATGKPSTPFAG